MPDKPILVGVDFEEASRRALDIARSIAAGVGAPVVLVHVYQLPLYTYPALEPLLVPPPIALAPEIRAAAEDTLVELAASVGIPASRALVREGNPVEEILAAAAAIDARMIALGTHGRRGLSHVLLGSVAEQVVRRAPVPVLTVRGPA